MSQAGNSILYLFMRPGEPVYVPKGDKKVTFCVPPEYLPERHRQSAARIFDSSTGGLRIPIIKLASLPDLTILLKLKHEEPFSVFIPRHGQLASELIEIFLDTKTYDEFLSVAVYCRDQVNTAMFIYALYVAIVHHPETRHLSPPSVCQIFPHKFVPGHALKLALREAYLFPGPDRKPIVLEREHTATGLEPEHRVAYFREDLGINLHHWHWHAIYVNSGKCNIVNKDRRGELFYYMHEQIVARYNFERLSNKLSLVKPLSDLREPIPEAYFSKLGADMATGRYPGRQANTILRDITIQSRSFQIQDLARMRDRILDSIHKGYIELPDQKHDEPKLPIDIDILGNIVEASILSPNPTFYGNLHNDGHIAIGFSHDPDNRNLESHSVMAENATAMRDPIFYRWHAFINNIFQEYKTRKLVPYRMEELYYEDVEIKEVEVTTRKGPCYSFSTHWQQSDVDIAGGLDFQTGGPVPIRFTHLIHEPFSYRIMAENSCDTRKLGTVRIFMGPKRNESKPLISLEKQRHLMIELDKFVVILDPGVNIIDRRSEESSVTIPFEQTFPKINEDAAIVGNNQSDNYDYCGCGWPQHMLIPMGTPEGMEVDLFFMISNYDDDRVDQEGLSADSTCCKEAMSYCGRKNHKYPDRRAMGYPFDRVISKDHNNWQWFLTPNMHVLDWKITHTNIVSNTNTVDSE